jgi:hypothetical protein
VARTARKLKDEDVKKVMTMGDVVNRLVEIKDEKSTMSAREKTLNEEKEQLEKDLLAMMQEQGTAEVAVAGKRVSFKLKPLPQIENGAELWKFVKKHDRYDLYYARLKQAEYEELYHLNGDKPLPGTKVVEKTEISIRSVSVAV